MLFLNLNILETNKISFASYSFIQKSWSNFNIRAPDAYLAPSYLIATVSPHFSAIEVWFFWITFYFQTMRILPQFTRNSVEISKAFCPLFS